MKNISYVDCKKRSQEIAKLFNQSFHFVSKKEKWDKNEIDKKICYSMKYPPYASIIMAQNEEGKIIGLISIQVAQTEKHKKYFKNLKYSKKYFRQINWLIVDKNYQKNKIGSMLLNKAEEVKSKYSDTMIILSCDKSLISFYKRNGFKESGIEENDKYSGKEMMMYKEF